MADGKLPHSEEARVLTNVERPELERRVLDYFHQNSHAMDSAEGVARFWVGENLRLVERCLLDLHRQGLLQKRTIAGTECYFLQEDPQRSQAEVVEKLQTRNAELRETVASLGATNEIAKTVTGLFDLNELYDSVVRIVARHLQARRVSILVCEADGETMALVASVGITKQEALESRVKMGEGIAGRVAASQQPLLAPSFLIAPLTVSHPIRYQRKRVGVINVSDRRSGDPFNEQDLEFLSTLSSQVAVAIEHARLVKDMQALGRLIQAGEAR